MSSAAASSTAKAAATTASNKTTSIRVSSYNVLSSKLARASHFTKNNPDHLEFTNRLPKVLSKLDEEISRVADTSTTTTPPAAVICLQEVSYDWAGHLHTFFANRGYTFVTGLYGKHYSGYMGVGLAYPIHKFETLSVDVARLSDEREGGWPRQDEEEEGVLTKLTDFLGKAWETAFPPEKKPIEPWTMSENRFNVLLTACLRDKATGASFCIGNYHMPCAFYAPAVMSIHAEMVAKRVQSLAAKEAEKEERDSLPYILTGDFNIIPGSPNYRLLTTGQLSKEDDSYPPSRFGVEWECGIKAMRSAYAVAEGSEPDFTNYAQTRDEEPFVDTLDYIFLSDEWKVSSVKKLVHRTDANGPYPNEEEPSDHVVIAADLEL